MRERLRAISVSTTDAQAAEGVLTIRDYRQEDAVALRRCVIELQEVERAIDPRLRTGESMADAYCEQMHDRCRRADGRIFVAEQDSEVVGFVTVLAREPFTQLDDPPGTHAFLTDLFVLSPHRRKGIGRQLLERAEAFARSAGACELRIGVLNKNAPARRLYLAAAFVPHLEIFTKKLAGT